MMLDVGLLKGISLYLSFNTFELYELHFSSFSRYLIVSEGKILFRYISFKWACKKFNELAFS